MDCNRLASKWHTHRHHDNSPRGGNGNPLQYSCRDNPKDRGAWWATVWLVANSQTQLSTMYRIIGLWWLASELSRWLWVCRLDASVLQRVHNEAQGPLEVKSSAILDLVGSSQFVIPSRPCHSFKGCGLPASLLQGIFPTQGSSLHLL